MATRSTARACEDACESLLLKPNRSYGGEGVFVGPGVEQGEWDRRMDRALVHIIDRWVMQQPAKIPVNVVNITQKGGTCAVMVSAKALHTAMYRPPSAAKT